MESIEHWKGALFTGNSTQHQRGRRVFRYHSKPQLHTGLLLPEAYPVNPGRYVVAGIAVGAGTRQGSHLKRWQGAASQSLLRLLSFDQRQQRAHTQVSTCGGHSEGK